MSAAAAFPGRPVVPRLGGAAVLDDSPASSERSGEVIPASVACDSRNRLRRCAATEASGNDSAGTIVIVSHLGQHFTGVFRVDLKLCAAGRSRQRISM